MRKFSICLLAPILEKVRKKSRNHDLPKCVPEGRFEISPYSLLVHRGLDEGVDAALGIFDRLDGPPHFGAREVTRDDFLRSYHELCFAIY